MQIIAISGIRTPNQGISAIKPRQYRGHDVERYRPSLRFGATRRPEAVMRWRERAFLDRRE